MNGQSGTVLNTSLRGDTPSVPVRFRIRAVCICYRLPVLDQLPEGVAVMAE